MLDALHIVDYNKRMSEQLNLDYLTQTKFVSQPGLHTLEMTGRMILTAAALEDARYGHNEKNLLQLYHHDTRTARAEYKKTLGTNNDRFERLVVELGKTSMVIVLEQGVSDWQGEVDHFVDKAVLSGSGSSHVALINGRSLAEEPFTKIALRQYSDGLQGQLENLEILLPEPSFFTKQ